MPRSWESKGMSEDSAHVEIDEWAPSWVATLDKEEIPRRARSGVPRRVVLKP